VHDVRVVQTRDALAHGLELGIDLAVSWHCNKPGFERLPDDKRHVDARSLVVDVIDAWCSYAVFARSQDASRLLAQPLLGDRRLQRGVPVPLHHALLDNLWARAASAPASRRHLRLRIAMH
jgi:hypothetical protein